MTTTENRSEQQAKAQFESIKEMVSALDAACAADDEKAQEEAQSAIQQDPLSFAIRSAWTEYGKPLDPLNGEFFILLCTGGTECRIIGGLYDGEVCSARIEHQDWGTPWTEYPLDSDEDREVLLRYCREFDFGS